ncbi:MAG: PadR family transcriptional regulator [Acidimicrobiales bacterium]
MPEMRDPTYYTLAVLLEGRTHGYAILERVREMTSGRVRLTAGTLYGVLDRLVDEGLAERAGSEIVRGRARQYFEITDTGSGAVQAEADNRAEAAAAVHRLTRARPAVGNRPRRRVVPGVSFGPLSASWVT